MLTTQTSGSIVIQPGGTLHFINHGRRRLSFDAKSGYVWLTRDGDIKDYVLRSGDAIDLCAGDDVWLTLEGADAAGSLTLEPLASPVPRQPFWKTVSARFSARGAQPCRPAVQSASQAARLLDLRTARRV